MAKRRAFCYAERAVAPASSAAPHAALIARLQPAQRAELEEFLAFEEARLARRLEEREFALAVELVVRTS